MKKLALAGVAAAALIAIPVLAQQTEHRGPMAGPMTRAAVQAKVQAHFAKVDANRDGFVTQEEARAGREGMRAERQERRGEARGEMFARLDADHDGSISRAEFDARPALGKGGRAERKANRMERRAMRGGQRGAMMGRMGGRGFEMLDADKDGKVSMAEASGRALAMFDRVDANRDGTIAPEERRAAREAMRARRAAKQGS
jgi:hypothetical protein